MTLIQVFLWIQVVFAVLIVLSFLEGDTDMPATFTELSFGLWWLYLIILAGIWIVDSINQKQLQPISGWVFVGLILLLAFIFRSTHSSD